MIKTELTIELLQQEAEKFAMQESLHDEPALFGVTDGKAVGTYFEHKFQKYLQTTYSYIEGSSANIEGSSAKGIDFPELLVDMKVTSIKQPQSSCPFKSARQKIYGLGYSLLVFVYEKTDNNENKTGRLTIKHTVFVESRRTGDFQMTTGLRKLMDNQGNLDDIIAYFEERFLPVDDIQARTMAEEIVSNPPEIGYLTISNALQWRLQYSRIIQEAGNIDGINRIV